MSAGIEINKLLNIALGTAETVNFNALHGVLSEIIKTLGVGSKLVQNINGDSDHQGDGKSQFSSKIFDKRQTYNEKVLPKRSDLENKVQNLENKLNALDELPNNDEILKRVRQRETTVKDIWQFININRRLSATETAIEKLSSLLEHALSELGGIKEFENDLQRFKNSVNEIVESNKEIRERLEMLENSGQNEDILKLRNLQEDLQSKVELLPTKRDLDTCMKWPDFESALKYGSTSESESSNKDILDIIKQLGDMASNHHLVLNNIETLQDTMPTKADKKELEELQRKQDISEDLTSQINEFNTKMENMINWKDEMIDKSNEDLNNIHQNIKEFRENLKGLNISTRKLIEDGDKRQGLIDRLHSSVEDLEERKADKDSVAMEMDSKADKLVLDNMISKFKFDASFGSLEQNVSNILNRLAEQEAALQGAISKLNDDVDGKLDRLEIDPLKEYINKRIKANKCKHVDLPINDDSAAGMTKPAMKFHCISCARPVEAQPGMSAIPLPQYPGFPPSKSSRPYAAFDAEQMRQQTRGNYDDHVSTRPCGGQHTLTYSTRRVNKTNYYYKEDEGTIVYLRDENPIQGHDGQLYKGREYNEQLPTLQQTSPQNPSKPPSAPTNPQASPRSQTPARPRSAMIR